MIGLAATFWSALGGLCTWRAECANDRAAWWIKQARACERRARGKLKARR